MIVTILCALLDTLRVRLTVPPPMPFDRGEYFKRWTSDCSGRLSVSYVFDFQLCPPVHINCRCFTVPVERKETQ